MLDQISKRLTFSIVWRSLIALIVIIGLSMDLCSSGTCYARKLTMYTSLSNLLCGLLCLYLAIVGIMCALAGDKNIPTITFVKPAFTVMIAITGLVWHILLAGSEAENKTAAAAIQLLHTVVPLMMVIDWLVLDAKSIRSWWPLAFCGIPFAYFIFSLIRAQAGGPLYTNDDGRSVYYWYPFIDFGDPMKLFSGNITNHNAIVWINVIILTIAFGILAYMFYGIEKLVAFAVRKYKDRYDTAKAQPESMTVTEPSKESLARPEGENPQFDMSGSYGTAVGVSPI